MNADCKLRLEGVSTVKAELMFKDIAEFDRAYGAKLGCSDLLRRNLRQLGSHIMGSQIADQPDFGSKATVLAWRLECDRDQTPDGAPTDAQTIAADAIEALRKAGRFRPGITGKKQGRFGPV